MNQDEVVKQAKRQIPLDWKVEAGYGGAFMYNTQETIPSTSDDLDNEIVKTILISGDEKQKVEISVNLTMYFDDDDSYDLMVNQVKHAPAYSYEVDFRFDTRNLTIEYSIMAFIDPDGSVGGSVVLALEEIDNMMIGLRKVADTKILRGLN